MLETLAIPKILIYEEFDGHPIYRKGYKEVMLGLKKAEEINMGTSTLQWFITNIINRFLARTMPQNYVFGSGELGLHITKNTSFSADVAIFRAGRLKVGFHSIKYPEVMPDVVVEVDIKIDESEYFQTEEEYCYKKTERLLKAGVERVIWIFSSSRRILVADNLQKWEFISWDLPFKVIDDYEINLWELMLAGGFEIE